MKREKKYRYDNSSIDGNFYFDENEKEELERKRSKASGCEWRSVNKYLYEFNRQRRFVKRNIPL